MSTPMINDTLATFYLKRSGSISHTIPMCYARYFHFSAYTSSGETNVCPLQQYNNISSYSLVSMEFSSSFIISIWHKTFLRALPLQSKFNCSKPGEMLNSINSIYCKVNMYRVHPTNGCKGFEAKTTNSNSGKFAA